MQLSISSSITDSIKDSAKLALNLNMGLEISRFPNFQKIDCEFKNIVMSMQKSLLDYNGFLTLHGLFFDESVASNDPAIKLISQKRHKQSLTAAKAINANTIVFHSGNKGMKHKISQNRFRENSILFWKEFIKEFEDADITAVIENVHERHPHQILDIVKEVNSPYLKVSLDTGHANLFSEIEICDWVKIYGKHLHHMHIHNNFGDDDSHNSLIEGTINFAEIFNTLQKENLSPIIVFEMFTQKNLKESLYLYHQLYGETKCQQN